MLDRANMPAMTDDVLISVCNLKKYFPIHAGWLRRQIGEVKAIDDVSLDIKKGETFGLVGESGSGKSTTLKIVTGVLQPTQGKVEVKGRGAALLELGTGFNPEFTGRENVQLNASIIGLSRAEMAAKFDEIAAFADIGRFIDQPVKTYSSGMMVRLGFAVHTALEPEILIIDEALSVGDDAFRRKCFARLERLRAAHQSFFQEWMDV